MTILVVANRVVIMVEVIHVGIAMVAVVVAVMVTIRPRTTKPDATRKRNRCRHGNGQHSQKTFPTRAARRFFPSYNVCFFHDVHLNHKRFKGKWGVHPTFSLLPPMWTAEAKRSGDTAFARTSRVTIHDFPCASSPSSPHRNFHKKKSFVAGSFRAN